jgi:hypothetical protein
MRALRQYLLAPLVVAAAFVALGASAQLAAAPVTHSHSALADPICPSGTNWDNLLHVCR